MLRKGSYSNFEKNGYYIYCNIKKDDSANIKDNQDTMEEQEMEEQIM